MWGPDGKCLWSEGSWGPLLCHRPVSPSQSMANAGYCLATVPGFQSWYTARQKEKSSHCLSGTFRLVVKPLENKYLEDRDSTFLNFFFKLLRVYLAPRHYCRRCTRRPLPLRRWQSIKGYKQYPVVNAKIQLCTGTTALWLQRIKLQSPSGHVRGSYTEEIRSQKDDLEEQERKTIHTEGAIYAKL